MSDQHTTPAPAFVSTKDAKAQAKAAKAYSKATRPWYKKKRIILPLAVLLLILIIQLMTRGSTDEASTANAGPAAAAPTQAASPDSGIPGIGAKVRDGKFEFVVTGVERPGKTLTSQFGTTETAQGEYVIVRVSVTNIGDEAQMLDSSGQRLINDKGQEFSPSSAIMSLKGAEKFFLQNINPGNTVAGAPLLFDVARGTKIATVELHDSPFSDGVKVKVS